MNTTDFTIKKTTVVAVNPTNTGTEIWARYEDGREVAYRLTSSLYCWWPGLKSQRTQRNF